MAKSVADSPSAKKKLADAIRAAGSRDDVPDDASADDDEGGPSSDDETGDGGGSGGAKTKQRSSSSGAADPAKQQQLLDPRSGISEAGGGGAARRGSSCTSTDSKSSHGSSARSHSKKGFRAAATLVQTGAALKDEPVVEGAEVTTEEAFRRPLPRHSSSERSFGDDTDEVYKSLHISKTPGLTIQQLVDKIKQKKKAGIYDEYAEIKKEPFAGTFRNARDKVNVDKNRYKDVLCYDHTRVVLQPLGDDSAAAAAPGGDYINANYVDGYKQRSAYICCMGPLPTTFTDFWKMIWQEHVRTIVMTTKCVEKNKAKCGQYWPPNNNGTLVAGPFDIHNAFVDNRGDYEISTLVLTHRKTSRTRTLKHYLFLSWPDYGVPSSPSVLLKFLQDIRQAQAAATASLGDGWKGHQRGPPIVIHCSAGVGRTGTVAAVDICLYRLAETKTVNIQETVRRLRSQRAHSIQMPDQYLFCHLSVVEYAVSQGFIPPVDLSSYIA